MRTEGHASPSVPFPVSRGCPGRRGRRWPFPVGGLPPVRADGGRGGRNRAGLEAAEGVADAASGPGVAPSREGRKGGRGGTRPKEREPRPPRPFRRAHARKGRTGTPIKAFPSAGSRKGAPSGAPAPAIRNERRRRWFRLAWRGGGTKEALLSVALTAQEGDAEKGRTALGGREPGRMGGGTLAGCDRPAAGLVEERKEPGGGCLERGPRLRTKEGKGRSNQFRRSGFERTLTGGGRVAPRPGVVLCPVLVPPEACRRRDGIGKVAEEWITSCIF